MAKKTINMGQLIAVNSLGGLIFGYNTGIIALALASIAEQFALSSILQGVLTASILVGALIGSATSGLICDKIGRKKTILMVGVITIGGAIFSMFSPLYAVLCVARAILGYAVGAASVSCPMYVSEMAKTKHRGKLGIVFQIAVTLGIFLGYVVQYGLNQAGIQGDWYWNWRAGFGIGAVFGVGILILSFLIPESTYWLEAVRVARENNNTKNSAGWGTFFQPRYGKFVGLGFMLAISLQLTGVNAIMYYAPKILTGAGFDIEDTLTLIVGAWNFVVTFFPLLLVDRAGRKPLMIAGLSIMCGSLILVAASFYAEDPFANGIIAIVGIGIFLFGFETGPGTNFWVLVNEVFPNEVRAGANSFINMLQWLLNVALALAFPPLVDAIGVSNTFWIFAGIGVLCLIYIVISVNESKGSELGKTDVSSLHKKDQAKTHNDIETPNSEVNSVDNPAPQAA
jgi:MFS family permease